MLYSLVRFAFVSALASVASAAAVVRQVQLCDRPDCPWVSRVGMGTLHLGDSISGISNPTVINAWIRKAVSLGINLFDLADVSREIVISCNSNFNMIVNAHVVYVHVIIICCYLRRCTP